MQTKPDIQPPASYERPEVPVVSARPSGRFSTIDVLRGFSCLSMICFHGMYDAVFIFGATVDWFSEPLISIWRNSISWTFLLLAGLMCVLSRSNAQRALRYGLFAAALFVITTLAAVDTPISFGVIFCMAASTALYEVLDRLHCAPRGYSAAALLGLAFILCLELPHGVIGLPAWGFVVKLPSAWYSLDALSFLGFMGPHFASGDYYPLLPYSLLFLAGSALGAQGKKYGWPRLMYALRCTPLNIAGRYPLWIYALHQPLLLLVFSLVFGH